MNAVIKLITLVVAAALLNTGCDDPTSGRPESDSVIYRGNGGDPGTLDPARADDIHAFNVLADIYEGLVTEAPDGQLVPGVAKSWSVSSNGLVYEFFLDEDARWSDGTRVVAGDFERSFRRVANPDTASSYAYLLKPILGFTEALAGEIGVDRIGVNAVDDGTLRITLSRPTSHLLSLMALAVTYPEHPSREDPRVGNGAYVLQSRQARGNIALARNPAYRAAETVQVERIVFVPVENLQTELNMYRAGELDITNSVPMDYIRSNRRENSKDLRIAPTLALYYLAYDLGEAPFDNRSLRQALSMAIDRHDLVEIIGRGELPAWSIVPPGVSGYEGAAYQWRNLEESERKAEAMRLYREAGYGIDNPLTIKLLYDTGDIHETVALAIHAMWSDTLGVNVELEKREWAYFLDSRALREEWDVMRFAWFGDYNSPATFLEIFSSNSAQNLAGFSDAEFDSILMEASAEKESGAVIAKMRDAESILIDAYPVVPLYFYVSKHLVNPRVGGFEVSVTDRHPSRFLYIEQ